MIIKIMTLHHNKLVDVLQPIGSGFVIAVIVSVIVATLPMTWTWFAIGGVLLVLLSLFIKEVKVYWLAIYLAFLPIERSRGLDLTKPFVNASEIIETLGVPPSANIRLILSPTDIVFLGLLIIWLLRVLTRQERIYFPKVSYLLVAYLGWVTFSSVLKAPYLYLSVVELAQQYKYFLIYLYIVNAINSKEQVKRLIPVLMFCLLVQGTLIHTSAITGWRMDPLSHLRDDPDVYLVGYYEGSEDSEGPKRAAGSVSPEYLLFLIPLALTRFLINRRTVTNWLYLLLFILGTAGLYLTGGRGPLLGLVCGLISTLWLAYLRPFSSKKWLFVIVFVGVLSLPLLTPVLYDYLTSRPTFTSGRFYLWEQGARMLVANPVLGVGLNNSTAVKLIYEEELPGLKANPIHNFYLSLAAETGVVGFMLYTGFFVVMGIEALRSSKSSDLDIASFSVAIFSSYIALSVHLSSSGTFIVGNTMLWFYTGFIMALRRMEQPLDIAQSGKSVVLP